MNAEAIWEDSGIKWAIGPKGQHLDLAVPCNAKSNQLLVWFVTPSPLEKKRPYVHALDSGIYELDNI